METTTPQLQLVDLEIGYGELSVVRDVNLTVERGERVAIVGQSGSGKSTVVSAVLRLLAGSGRIAGGSILFDGEDIAAVGEARMRELRGSRIALVPQDPATNLNPTMRVGDQIADALARDGVVGGTARRRVVELMAEAGIADAQRRARQYPHEFSGGMRQRVLIAMALARDPELLIADEPTSALDVTVQRRILDHLQTLVDSRGTTMLFITHDLGLAADRADRIVVMHEGQIVEQGAARQVLTSPEHPYTRSLIAAAPGLIVARENVEGDVEASADGSAPQPPSPGPVVELRKLVKEYRLRGSRGQLVRAVDDVSFTVARGTTTALVGESGSGKTTISRMLLGLERPTAGDALIDGVGIAGAAVAERRRLRRLVQPVFQDPYGSLNPMFSVERLIDEPLRVFRIGDRSARRHRVLELLDQVALSRDLLTRRPSQLSGGQRQRVAIARALAPGPELLICDEAVSALDVLVQDQVLKLLDDLQQNLGVSYLFISHDLAVVRQIADEVVVLRDGKVEERGKTAEVFLAPQADYTRELLGAIPGADVLG